MESKLEEILRTRQFPGIAGLSDGPGSGATEVHFNKPDAKKEVLRVLRDMEDSGKLKDPKMREAAMTKWNAVKDLPKPSVDYGKTGTALDQPRKSSVTDADVE